MIRDKFDFGAADTPLTHYKELSKHLGVEFYVKRDDLCGVAFGNYPSGKLRKLEFIMAEAVEQKATSIIVSGNCQSNHARQLSLCAKRLGLKAHCVYQNDTSDTSAESMLGGNVLLSKVYGADTYLVNNANDKVALLSESLRNAGETVYISNRGGSNSIGDLGYYFAFKEILEAFSPAFSNTPVDLYVCSGSGGTHAALHLASVGTNIRVVGVPNKRSSSDQTNVVLRCITTLIEHLSYTGPIGRIWFSEIDIPYGSFSKEIVEHTRSFLSFTGLMLDHVYTVKTYMAACRDIADGNTAKHVVLLNGGEPINAFAYQNSYSKFLDTANE